MDAEFGQYHAEMMLCIQVMTVSWTLTNVLSRRASMAARASMTSTDTGVSVYPASAAETVTSTWTIVPRRRAVGEETAPTASTVSPVAAYPDSPVCKSMVTTTMRFRFDRSSTALRPFDDIRCDLADAHRPR